MIDAAPAALTGVYAVVRDLLKQSYGLFPDELVPVLAELVKEHTGATHVELLLVDLDQRELRGLGRAGHEGASYPILESAPGLAFREEVPVVQSIDGGRQLWLPVLDSAERLGVLGLVDDGSASLDDWLVLGSLLGELVMAKQDYGDHIAVARRRQPVSLAAEMRWSMLPPLMFSSPRVCVTGILQPSHLVAGDAFDYAVGDNTAIVGIFDAMGHDLQASRVANLVVGGFRSGRRRGLTVVETLTMIDDTVTVELGQSRFATAQIVELDLSAGIARIHTAGHPPPVHLRMSGPPEIVEVQPGRPLGLGPSEYVETTVQLEPGDALLLHSDGIYEARSPDGEDYGWDRMIDLAQALFAVETRPPEVLRQVIHDAIDFQGDDVRDDATLAMVRWQPSIVGVPSAPRAENAIVLD